MASNLFDYNIVEVENLLDNKIIEHIIEVWIKIHFPMAIAWQKNLVTTTASLEISTIH